ncbi:MAG TPA: hypothetical protein VD948_08590 [Rhodothermales bacterium]|nr:hypothetical protein [Rhodothermales bacterium]
MQRRLKGATTLMCLGAGTVGAAATTFLCPGMQTSNATEANRQALVPRPEVLIGMRVRTTTAQPAGGSLVFTVRKNGADADLVVTIAANGAAGAYAATGAVAFAADDLVSIKITNNDGANSSAGIGSVSFIWA